MTSEQEIDDLVNQHIKLAESYARKMETLGHDHDTALSNGLMALWETAKNYDPEQGAFSTLYNIVLKNNNINQWKKEQLDALPHCIHDDSGFEAHLDTSLQEPFQSLAEKSAQESLKECMEILDSREKEVIEIMYYFALDNMTISEYAKENNMTRQNVYNIRDGALAKLKRCLRIIEE